MFRKAGAVAPVQEQLSLSAAKVSPAVPVKPRLLPRSLPTRDASLGVVKPRPMPVRRQQNVNPSNE